MENINLMEEFDQNFTKVIIHKLKTRLERELSNNEYKVFTQPRSGIAYEMILDFISDEDKSRNDIEKYVNSVVKENN